MSDPFGALRAAHVPADPDPAFAAELRARLQRALGLPRGVVPVTIDAASPRPAAVPYLAVTDARAAIKWYREVFGATVLGEPVEMPDGRIGHAELEIGGGVFYLADEAPQLGVVAPRPGEASVSLMLPVPDADAVRERALAAGARGDREPYDGYGRRNAWIVDPFGHRWGLHSPLAELTEVAGPAYRQGDVGFVSLWVPDAERAADFYRAVLGWDVLVDGGRRHVRGAVPVTGVESVDGPPTLFCCYAVDDIAAAVGRVRAAGGTVGDRIVRPEGPTADCTDDQGVRFALFEQKDRSGDRPPANGSAPGHLAYLTLEVVDSAAARAFYGTVLGWEFGPGSVADGWQVHGTTPMIGLSGGHERAAAVPMWRVPDVTEAVRRVRAAGGAATDPERQPYGTTASCRDDQGARFYLGEL